jgi:hypothetical protein
MLNHRIFAFIIISSTLFLTSCISYKGVTKRKLRATWNVTKIDDKNGQLGQIKFKPIKVNYQFIVDGKTIEGSSTWDISFEDRPSSFFAVRKSILTVNDHFSCQVGEEQLIYIIRWPKLGKETKLFNFHGNNQLNISNMYIEKK